MVETADETSVQKTLVLCLLLFRSRSRTRNEMAHGEGLTCMEPAHPDALGCCSGSPGRSHWLERRRRGRCTSHLGPRRAQPPHCTARTRDQHDEVILRAVPDEQYLVV